MLWGSMIVSTTAMRTSLAPLRHHFATSVDVYVLKSSVTPGSLHSVTGYSGKGFTASSYLVQPLCPGEQAAIVAAAVFCDWPCPGSGTALVRLRKSGLATKHKRQITGSRVMIMISQNIRNVREAIPFEAPTDFSVNRSMNGGVRAYQPGSGHRKTLPACARLDSRRLIGQNGM